MKTLLKYSRDERSLTKLLESGTLSMTDAYRYVANVFHLDFLSDKDILFISSDDFVIEISTEKHSLQFTFIDAAYNDDFWYIEKYFGYFMHDYYMMYYLLKYFLSEFFTSSNTEDVNNSNEDVNINEDTSDNGRLMHNTSSNGVCCRCVFSNNYCKSHKSKSRNFFTHTVDKITIDSTHIISIKTDILSKEYMNLCNLYDDKFITHKTISQFQSGFYADDIICIKDNIVSINNQENRMMTFLFAKGLNVTELRESMKYLQ